MHEIQSASKNEITRLRKLQKKKYRDEFHSYIAEGERAVEQILKNSPGSVSEIFIDQSIEGDFFSPRAEPVNPEIIRYLPSDLFSELSDTDNPQGIMAICKMPDEMDLEEISHKKFGCLLALDRIQDPGNMGTIIRTAAWFGVDGLLLAKGSVDIFHPKVVRSTAGATGIIPYKNGDLEDFFKRLEESGWETVLLTRDNDAEEIPKFEPSGKVIITVGNEANGIDRSLFTKNRKVISIPGEHRKGQVESLNAAVAGGIALYEFFKKINF